MTDDHPNPPEPGLYVGLKWLGRLRGFVILGPDGSIRHFEADNDEVAANLLATLPPAQ